jgi:hypothetical protein
MSHKKSINLIILSLILFSFIFSPFSYSQTTTSQYKGKIGNYPITIEVYKEGKDKIKGRYMYDKVGKWLRLEGKILKNNRVIIYEYDENNKNTGRFIGKIEKGNVLKIEKHINNKTKKYLNVRLPKIVLGGGVLTKEPILKIRKYKLTKEPYYTTDVFISPNGKYAAVIYRKDNKDYVQINDTEYGPYDRFWTIEFSGNDSKYGIIFGQGCTVDGATIKCEAWYVQINNKIYGPSQGVIDLAFSSDGSKYVFGFTKDNKRYVQVNEKVYGPYDHRWDVSCGSKVSNCGWIFKKYKEYKEEWYVQINDKIFGPYDDVSISINFSESGQKYGWEFVKDNRVYIQINNKTYGPYDRVSVGPVFSKNESTVGWIFEKNGKRYLQINNKIYEIDEDVINLAISDDGSKYCLVSVKNNKEYYYIQLNNKTYGPYDRLILSYNFPPVFSSDCSKYGWIFEKDNKSYVQINDNIYGPYDDVGIPVISSDGSRYAWRFKKDNKKYIQINDNIYGPYDNAYEPTFSNDSSKWGWVFNNDGRNYIQIKNKIYGPYYNYATFTFTKDNKAYIAYISGNELVIEEVE